MSAKSPRLTNRAQELLELAQEAAARQGRGEIDTEDLLFGMVSQDEGTARRVLRALGVDSVLQLEAILSLVNSSVDTDNLPPVLVLLLDEDGKLLSASAAAQELLDSHEAEILRGISFINREDLSELRIGDRTFLSRASHLRDGTKAVTLYEKVKNLSLIYELEALSDALQDTLRHDLMGPLTSIRASVGVLPFLVELDDRGERTIETMSAAANDMMHVIETIDEMNMPLQNLATRGVGPKQHPCDLKQLVSEYVASLKEKGMFQSIPVNLDIPDAECRIWGDESLLASLMLYLPYFVMPRAPADTAVRISLSHEPSGLWLRILDQGPKLPGVIQVRSTDPIARRIFPQVFELLMVDRVAQLHGGRFEIRNLPEGGTEFAVLFPSAIVISAGSPEQGG